MAGTKIMTTLQPLSNFLTEFSSSSSFSSSLFTSSSPLTYVTIGSVTIVGVLSVAAWHFLRDNFDEKRNRLGDNEYKKW